MINLTSDKIAQMIDHTLLKPEASDEQIIKLCHEAMEYHFWSVCVNPYRVPLAYGLLKNSAVRVCTVIGFPLGATLTAVKANEAKTAVESGAAEVDMVLNVGALKSGNEQDVLDDIRAVVQTVQTQALVKVILETGLLTETEKIKACELSLKAGADFVKTSTGFGPGGATTEDIFLMRRVVGPDKGVKASGGVRDLRAAVAMINAGANRIGTSSGIKIITGAAASNPQDY